MALGAFFLPQVWQAFQAQVQGTDELALNYGWASIVEHLCNLWLIALLAAFRQSGSTLLALLVAACLLYLGVAAIAVPGNPGSWGFAGGAIAILCGAAYVSEGPAIDRGPAVSGCIGPPRRRYVQGVERAPKDRFQRIIRLAGQHS